MKSYGQRLEELMQERGQVCVGIDPHPHLLQEWGLPDTAAGVREFCLTVVEAVGEKAPALKPQSAFFERHGSAGIAVLEEVLKEIRSRGAIALLDVKRGDIGSTMAGYAEAYLPAGAPLEADAITVSPYLGFGSLAPVLELALRYQKGIYILALTSNPDGPDVQHAVDESGKSVAGTVVERAKHFNINKCDTNHIGNIGLVVGATVGTAINDLNIDLLSANASILAPGFGAQGIQPAQVDSVFGKAKPRVLVSASRSILQAGPKWESVRKTFVKFNNQIP